MDLFDPKLPFFKGNLHCHTTVSDGKLNPDEVVALYRDLGYDFLALTDHRRLSAPTHLEGCMLLLSGMEMDYTLPGEVLHLIGVGMDERLAGYDLSGGPQRCINLYRRCGGRAIVAHPAWSLNTVATLTAQRVHLSVEWGPRRFLQRAGCGGGAWRAVPLRRLG